MNNSISKLMKRQNYIANPNKIRYKPIFDAQVNNPRLSKNYSISLKSSNSKSSIRNRMREAAVSDIFSGTCNCLSKFCDECNAREESTYTISEHVLKQWVEENFSKL